MSGIERQIGDDRAAEYRRLQRGDVEASVLELDLQQQIAQLAAIGDASSPMLIPPSASMLRSNAIERLVADARRRLPYARRRPLRRGACRRQGLRVKLGAANRKVSLLRGACCTMAASPVMVLAPSAPSFPRPILLPLMLTSSSPMPSPVDVALQRHRYGQRRCSSAQRPWSPSTETAISSTCRGIAH